jgi:hypothetical protein
MARLLATNTRATLIMDIMAMHCTESVAPELTQMRTTLRRVSKVYRQMITPEVVCRGLPSPFAQMYEKRADVYAKEGKHAELKRLREVRDCVCI